MNVIAFGMFAVGGLLMWSAVTGRNPLDVMKSVLDGKPVPPRGAPGSPKGNVQTPNGPPLPPGLEA